MVIDGTAKQKDMIVHSCSNALLKLLLQHRHAWVHRIVTRKRKKKIYREEMITYTEVKVKWRMAHQ